MTKPAKPTSDWSAVDKLTDEEIDRAIRTDADAAPDLSSAIGAGAFRRIDPHDPVPDITAIRARSGLSQRAFAARYGLDLRALQDWEQGRRQPSKSLQSYLRVIDRNGDMVAAALAGAE